VGWAERARKRTLARYKPLTAKECLDLARNARTLLGQFEVKLDRTSDLEDMIRDVEFLGSFPGDPLSPTGAWATDKQRTAYAYARVEQTRRLVRSLAQAPLVKNADGHLRWLRKRLDRLRIRTFDEAKEREAGDLLFELEIAGRLAMWERHEISFEEPDIILTAGTSTVALACKRPRSEKSLKSALIKAGKQLRNTHRSGFIVIGAEYLLHGVDEQGRPATIVTAFSEGHAAAQGEEALRSAEEACRPEIEKVFAEGTGGVLFVGVLVYITQNPMIFGYRWITRIVANPDVRYAPQLLSLIQDILLERYPTQENLNELLGNVDA